MRRTPGPRYLLGGEPLKPRWATLAVVLATAGAACASTAESPDPPAPVPAGALPGNPQEVVVIDAAALASDAEDAPGLLDLLEDAGFVIGTERRFSQAMPGRRTMRARVLHFDDPAGARRYLEWLEEHADEVIGEAEAGEPLERPDAALYVHEPNACCAGDSRVALVAWSDGAVVVTLEVGGPATQVSDLPGLAARLDEAVGSA
ncbi:MAG TPA: hypothetical protein VIC58_02905 [Actinomycetota bacterium]